MVFVLGVGFVVLLGKWLPSVSGETTDRRQGIGEKNHAWRARMGILELEKGT